MRRAPLDPTEFELVTRAICVLRSQVHSAAADLRDFAEELAELQAYVEQHVSAGGHERGEEKSVEQLTRAAEKILRAPKRRRSLPRATNLLRDHR